MWERVKRYRNILIFLFVLMFIGTIFYVLEYKGGLLFGQGNIREGNEGMPLRNQTRRFKNGTSSRGRARKGTRGRGVGHANRLRPITAVVFDFDETLGCFSQFSEVVYMLEDVYGMRLSVEDYVQLLQIFDRYIRPDIGNLLRGLYKRRNSSRGRMKIVIYTNNMGGRKWVRMVASALEKYFGLPKLFDHIIYAYKVQNRVVESRRTSHDKTYSDFLACTSYGRNTKLIFVDDVMHPNLWSHPNVSYVHLADYKWSYTSNEIRNRLHKAGWLTSGMFGKNWVGSRIRGSMVRTNEYNRHIRYMPRVMSHMDMQFEIIDRIHSMGSESKGLTRHRGSNKVYPVAGSVEGMVLSNVQIN